MLERIAAARVAEIVDVGCGDGRFTRELAQLPGTRRAVGVDVSSRAIGLARAMNQDLPAIRFIDLDITAREWPEEAFDAAVLMEVIEHLPEDAVPAFLRAVRALLRPGGRLFLTVPHANVPLEAKHFQHFTVEAVLRVLRECFTAIEVVPFERRSWQRGLIKLMLQNRFCILNHQRALAAIYAWYKKRLFRCSGEHQCQRLFVEAKAL
jgi:2-polyprenyl-3-methyl-5-hydroxy-6-metoxy-1,4-benzoquinol methylase